MMGTEDRTLFCFCHWGWKNNVLPDGSTLYVGGITRQVIAKTGIKYIDFVNAVFDRLGIIDPSDKILHYTVKFDSSQLIELRDQEDVNTLLQFNDGFVHVYVSSLGKAPYSRPPSGGVKKVEIIIISDSEPDTTLAGDDVNDLASPLKKARFRSAGDTKPQKKEAVGGDGPKHAGVTSPCSNSMNKLNQNGVCLPEGDVQNNNSKIGTVNKQASRPQSGRAEKVKLIVDSESYAIPDSDPSDVFDCPDSEFNDFDKHRAENCFAAGQIWTCYDMDDGMPRLYALIRKVSSPEFKIKFSWFEPHPEDERESAWIRADLPVGCGKFRHGNSEYTSSRLIFSHQVQCEKRESGMLIVYPRKGETWALFKDWDICWSADPDDHRNYTYEVVEILCDYVGDAGVKVSYLDKVNGFVSLFQGTRITVAGTFYVKPNELYKFSHRIPSFKMAGTEREGVPEGSFELDPASLPLNPDDIWYPEKVKEGSRTSNSQPGEEVLSTVPPGTRDKSRTSEVATTLSSLGT